MGASFWNVGGGVDIVGGGRGVSLGGGVLSIGVEVYCH